MRYFLALSELQTLISRFKKCRIREVRMKKDRYTISEIAKMSGLTTRTIRNYLADGQVHGEKRDGKWEFS